MSYYDVDDDKACSEITSNNNRNSIMSEQGQ